MPGRAMLRRLLAALLVLAAAPAGAVTELRIAPQEETIPKYIRSPSGETTGLCVDLVRALERADPELRFADTLPWMPIVRIQSEIASGAQDAVCAFAHTEERDKHMIFLQPVLFTLGYHLVARVNDPVVINNWDDVRKLGKNGVVLTNRGLSATQFMDAVGGITYDNGSATSGQNMQKLVAGRARFFIHRSQGMAEMIERAGMKGRVRVLPTMMGGSELFFTLGKHVAPATVERVQRALLQLQKSGELDVIRKRWR